MTARRAGPADLVAEARDLLRLGTAGAAATAGLWPRAAAVLTRQAIELAMGRLWDVRAPGLAATSFRCQLLCLRVLLDDGDVAGRTAVAYDGLSRAIHHHPYELAPTRDELLAWMEAAWELSAAVDGIAVRAAPGRTGGAAAD